MKGYRIFVVKRRFRQRRRLKHVSPAFKRQAANALAADALAAHLGGAR